jgi:hypothetical protein
MMIRNSTCTSLTMYPVWALLTAGAMVACGGSDETHGNQAEDEPDRAPGIHRTDSHVVFRTEQFSLDPGQERFVCYTKTLEQDLVIDGYMQRAKPFLHHVVFAKTTGTEPEGSSECDVLFRFAWEPIFLAGAGDSEIQFPEGVGQVARAPTTRCAFSWVLPPIRRV